MLFSLVLQLEAGARAATAALASASNIFLLHNNLYTIGAFLHTPPADFSNTVHRMYSLLLIIILGNVGSRDCRF
jgi:hypothetical protein